MTKMAATMERFVAVVKQYPGQQQVDLAVVVLRRADGSLTATEQRDKYKAQAVEYAEVHEFPGATKGACKASVRLQGTGGAAKKGPTSVLSRVLVNNTNSGQNAKTA